MKKAIRIIFFFAIGIAFIWWFVAKLTEKEIDQMLLSFSEANYFWFFVAILVNVLSALIRAKRWQQLLKPLGHNPRLLPTFLSVMSGYLANLAVPRLGEIMRCGLLKQKENVPFDKAIGTVLVERVIDLILFILILLLALLLEFSYIKDYIYNNFSQTINFDNLKTYMLYFFLCIVSIGILLYVFRKKITKTKPYKKILEFLKGLAEGLKSIFKLKNPLLFIFNSVFIWFLWILGTYIIFLCFNQTEHLSFKIAIIATVLGSIGPMLTPGGIGIFPAIIAETLAIYLIAKPIGYAAGWLLWIVSQLGAVILGLLGFIYFAQNKKSNERNPKNTI